MITTFLTSINCVRKSAITCVVIEFNVDIEPKNIMIRWAPSS